MPEPGLHPRSGPRLTSSSAERVVYDALRRGLPPGWFAWHSLRVRSDTRGDGENDFVLAIPGRGVIVLEVKGGQLRLEDGRWLQNGFPLRENPLDQAHGFKDKLIDVLRRQRLRQVPWIAVACCFPETTFDDFPPQPNLRGCLLGAQDMPYLSDALPELADRLLRKGIQLRSDDWIEAIHALWGELWIPKVSLGRSAALREAEFVTLDAQQLGLLDLLLDNARVHVRGGAGTGKTLLAIELYRRWSHDGGAPPLLLCWTRPLCLELKTAGVTDAWTVRELGADLLARAGRTMQNGDPPGAWTSATWAQVTKDAVALLAAQPAPHRRVIVDEAQDFDADDWALVTALAGDQPIWAFGDPEQRFWTDGRTPPAGLFPTRARLTARYRCPAPLVAFADRYRAGYVPAPDDEPPASDALRVLVAVPITLAADATPDGQHAPDEDTAPHDARAAAEAARMACLTAELDRLLAAGVAPSDIAVLSLAGRAKTRLGDCAHIGPHAVVRADDPGAPEQLVADTCLRFKGLERPWILVTELELAPTGYDVRMHIALTRATVGCTVIATPEELARDPRLSATPPATS
jgi:hypothetical protein